MNLNSWTGAVTPLNVLTTQAVTVSAPVSGTAIDVTDFTGSAVFLLESAGGTSDSLSTNGTFDTDASWTKGTGWTIDAANNNAATFGGHTTFSDLSQNQSLTAATAYTLVFTIANWTAGTVTGYLGGTAGTARGADGTYTEVIVCGAGEDPKLALRASSTFRGDIDTVKVMAAKCVIKVQESANNSDWTDVAGAVFASVYGVASLQKLELPLDARCPYLKTVSTVTGANGTFTQAIQFLGVKSYT